ncbi:hypothetical protein [Clostridium cylindrosporum]|uniref:Uncharacterized protein n=1 Tax=Clostridium cylindrosporum DSM 605 TaxID=1121307 RepID=A0A0J8DAH4_CLOCY|nr:hypothetical protein [Clostridium cylindrosporum]KMT23025.1 hypothetical protein CLCY_7c00720 [Clostridium cylindrosporum DSM 605]
MEYITAIGFGCTILGAVIGYLGYRRNYDNDLKKDTANTASRQSIIDIKLDYISKGVDDIRLDIKAQDKRIDELNNRMIKVEESTKSAHKRLDGIERGE